MYLSERGHVLRLTLLFAIATLVVGVGLLVWSAWSGNGNPRSTKGTSRSQVGVSGTSPADAGPELRVETRKELGVFDLGKGRKVRISTADTVDGLACLIEEADDGTGSSCLEGGLFSLRKAELVVSSEGGPEQFTALRVAGVAAPSIRAVSLVKTDGTTVELGLNAERAFVYESTKSDLDARIYPTALRLFGGNRKLVETVTFPPAG